MKGLIMAEKPTFVVRRYTYSLDYSVEALSKTHATKLIKEQIVADAKHNLAESGIDAWLDDVLVFSHISDEYPSDYKPE